MPNGSFNFGDITPCIGNGKTVGFTNNTSYYGTANFIDTPGNFCIMGMSAEAYGKEAGISTSSNASYPNNTTMALVSDPQYSGIIAKQNDLKCDIIIKY